MSVSFNKMNEVFDCIFTRPYAEDDFTLNEFVDDLTRRLSWKMFDHQEEVCFNISEKNPPMLKENVITYMQNVLNTELGWVRNYIICRMLIAYRMGNVDLGEEGEWYLREEFDEEGWADFNKTMNDYVWRDYAQFLGEEKTKEYFMRINRPEFIPKSMREDKIEEK